MCENSYQGYAEGSVAGRGRGGRGGESVPRRLRRGPFPCVLGFPAKRQLRVQSTTLTADALFFKGHTRHRVRQ